MNKISLKTLLHSVMFLSILIVLQSCSKDQEMVAPTPVKFSKVEAPLRPFFQRFEDEAAKRGITVDLTAEGIVGEIEEISRQHVAGQCSYSFNRPGRVTVDETFWNNSSSLFREFIVFHELGHCYLNRDHLEDAFNNGVCKSIMRSGTGDCFDAYATNSRDYYIDELFSTVTAK
ncbi:hypothetical protein QQ008_08020 [Fulvivirgaceae bacterium BMA10]|uniref:IrrE N-terminal-like domain-containing protein n=1 Tax=Splendidivirga corallicola TaxID=3051826 RepID=A0ABT8KNL0_9BACT|nr:hypothetical protein [Fulvivirgaceae bacterium BMA10]